ncbi:MAG: hypothetical protein AAFQ41_02285 [Cyanobacteria bacterium J06623_7]
MSKKSLNTLKVEINRLEKQNQLLTEENLALRSCLPDNRINYILELIKQRDRAREIAKKCQKAFKNKKIKKAQLESDLLRYQLNQVRHKEAALTEKEQNKKLANTKVKKSTLFNW